MITADLPEWIQITASIAVALVAAIIGVIAYLKKTDKESNVDIMSKLSSGIWDPKIVRDLITAIHEYQDENTREQKKLIRGIQDLRDNLQNNTEAVLLQTDATTNLLRFVNRPRSISIEEK